MSALPEDTAASPALVVALPDGTRLPSTLRAEEVADVWGISTWEVYASAKRGDLPVAPIVIGRRILRWPTVAVFASIGVEVSVEFGTGSP